MARKKKSYRRSGNKFGLGMLKSPMVKSAVLGLGAGAVITLAQQRGINIPIQPQLASAGLGFVLGGPIGALAGYFGSTGGMIATGSTATAYV